MGGAAIASRNMTGRGDRPTCPNPKNTCSCLPEGTGQAVAATVILASIDASFAASVAQTQAVLRNPVSGVGPTHRRNVGRSFFCSCPRRVLHSERNFWHTASFLTPVFAEGNGRLSDDFASQVHERVGRAIEPELSFARDLESWFVATPEYRRHTAAEAVRTFSK